MTILSHAVRAVAIAAGGLILYLAAETTLSHLGQTAGPGANLLRALAAGVGIGAVAIGIAWHGRHYILALVIGLALVCGEAYGLLSTAERMIAQRDEAQAPLRAAEEAHTAAGRRVTAADAALKAANAAAIEKAAEKHCQRNCRDLLQDAVTKAGLELHAARAALDAIGPTPASATPLADRTGLPAWALDLLQAALASIGANGLGAALIAFGAHGGPRPDRRALTCPMQSSGTDRPAAPATGPGYVREDDPAAMAADAQRLADFLASDGAPDGRTDTKSSGGGHDPDDSGPPKGTRKRTSRMDGRTARSAQVIALPVRTTRPDVPANAPAAKRDQVLSALLADLDAGRKFLSQADICEAYGVARSTLSDWMRAWEAEGVSFRRAQQGRVKHVARA